MKKILTKSLVLMVAIFLSVLFVAPAMLHADTAYVEVRPGGIGISALGQTAKYTAWAIDGFGGEIDVTATAVWTITNASIASNDGGGAFKATAQGDTWVFATSDGVTGSAGLNVWKPDLWVNGGPPGETTGFGTWAGGCSGLSWSLDVTGPTTYLASGVIPSDPWNPYFNAILSAGDYTATFTVGGTVQEVRTFSIYGYESSLDVAVGYAGETTTFTLNATNLSGKTADFELLKEISTDNWEMIYNENSIPIGSSPWSYVITQTLDQGHYAVNYFLDNFTHWGGGIDFDVVNRDVPQPPVAAAPPKPLTAEEQASLDLSIGQQADLYGKTNIGFTKMLYDNILGRAADDEGLNNWVTALNEGKITLSSVVYNFVFSKELESIISPSSPTEFVTFLYKNVLGRNPDPQGFAIWVDNMKNGMSKEDVLLHFIDSGEFKSICTMFGLTQ